MPRSRTQQKQLTSSLVSAPLIPSVHVFSRRVYFCFSYSLILLKNYDGYPVMMNRMSTSISKITVYDSAWILTQKDGGGGIICNGTGTCEKECVACEHSDVTVDSPLSDPLPAKKFSPSSVTLWPSHLGQTDPASLQSANVCRLCRTGHAAPQLCRVDLAAKHRNVVHGYKSVPQGMKDGWTVGQLLFWVPLEHRKVLCLPHVECRSDLGRDGPL